MHTYRAYTARMRPAYYPLASNSRGEISLNMPEKVFRLVPILFTTRRQTILRSPLP